jgi:hypothetical protein
MLRTGYTIGGFPMAMKTAAKLAKASGALEGMLGEIITSKGVNFLLPLGLPGRINS